MIKGWAAPEVEHTYARARALCQHMGEHPQRFPALFGLTTFYVVRAELGVASEFGEQLLHLAHQQHDVPFTLLAHTLLGFILFCRGVLPRAWAHLEQALALYDRQHHGTLASLSGFDPGVACSAFAAVVRWLLGYPDQALQHSRQALRLGQALSHPFSQAHALIWAAILHQLRREAAATWERAEATVTLATAQGFPFYLAGGIFWRGWARASQGQGAAGVAPLCQSLADLRAAGAEQARSWQLALLAEVYGQSGQPEAGLGTLEEALALVDTTGERFYEAELYRLQGELLQQVGRERQQVAEGQGSPEACLQRALAITRQQGAKSLELRAAVSLARLWQQQGKRQEASDLLAPVYGWFTEGFDTPDLQEARALLVELGGSPGTALPARGRAGCHPISR
jgi:predicted ATPase